MPMIRYTKWLSASRPAYRGTEGTRSLERCEIQRHVAKRAAVGIDEGHTYYALIATVAVSG